jgi:hypothetical protein
VFRKHFGTFTECETKAEIIKIDAGSRFEIAARDVTQLLFVWCREGVAQGKEIQQESAIRLRAGHELRLQASTGLEVLNFILPDLHHLLKHG